MPHLLAFDVVAPVPLFTGEPEKITTFMWEWKDEIARYSALGTVAAALWGTAIGVATALNLRGLFRGEPARLGPRLLCVGWLAGAFGFFTLFGDDLLLYSELWVGFVVLWVALGLTELSSKRALFVRRWCTLAFLVTTTWNNALFVRTMLERYEASVFPGAG